MSFFPGGNRVKKQQGISAVKMFVYETDFTNEPDWKETEESNDFALQNGDNKSKEQTPWENQESENTSGWIKTK